MNKLIVTLIAVLLSMPAYAAKPDKGDKGAAKECRKKVQAQIKELRKQMKACKGTAPAPEPVPEEPELPEEEI